MAKKKSKLKLEECEVMLKYLAKHEKNARVIEFLKDREVEFEDA